MTPGHFPTTKRRAQLTAVSDALGVCQQNEARQISDKQGLVGLGHQQRGQLAQRPDGSSCRDTVL
jgi:hypothetical protein